MLGSCGSEAEDLDIPEGEGLVKIDLMPEVGFQTKAVDENEYKDVNKYTVQVFKSGQESNPVIEDLILGVLFGISIMFLVSNSYNPFIYFRF